MSIFLDNNSTIIVQGITGSEGSMHVGRMLAAGANVVGGTNPRKAGQTVTINGQRLPVFGTVADAMKETGANVTVIFVPPAFAKSAIIEAIDAEIELAVVITEGIPVRDTAEAYAHARNKGTTRIIGPNCPGIITPGESLAGIIPANIAGSGPVGLVSKSGTLTYQMMYELADVGISTAVGIGGDPIIGTDYIDTLKAFEADSKTEAVVLIGEIGGDAEERAAEYIQEHMTKPVVAYVAGFTAPEGKTMGHAGAIVTGSEGTAQAKKEAFEAAGVRVGRTPTETAQLMLEIVATDGARGYVERTAPNLIVSDLAAAARAHEAVLGMEIVSDHGPIRTLGEVDGPQIKLLSKEGLSTPSPDATIYVSDINTVYRRAEDAGSVGVEIVSPLTDERPGTRRFFYQDPDGNVISVAEQA